jgi:hypothetical protein
MEQMDKQMASEILKYLAKQPIDHHSKEIQDLVPEMISMGIENLPAYFDSRMI